MTNDTRRSTSCVIRWGLLRTLAFMLLLLGTLTTILRIAEISSIISLNAMESTVTQLKNNRVKRIETPYVYKDKKIQQMCFTSRDMGIFSAIRQAANNFCMEGGWDRAKEGPVSIKKATKVSLYHVEGGIETAIFQNLMLDFVGVAIYRPIQTMAHDGGRHDPRFVFNLRLINCVCDELAEYYSNHLKSQESSIQQIWYQRLVSLPQNSYPMATICSPNTRRSEWDFVKYPRKGPDYNETVVFEDPVVLIARRDDHNPFFQIAAAFNVWVMFKALNWDITKTRVIHLDAGYPTSIDTLHKALLGPNYEIVDGATLMGKRVHFRGNVLLAPYENTGPMMQHLTDHEPCHESELIKTFRAESLQALNITPDIERELGVTKIRPLMVTVISRRPYGGRIMHRVWENEDEVIASMQAEYKDLNAEFRSIDYVNLTLHEQMKNTIESDMIISMHGAGLANVIWTRPMTTVVEIFPKPKKRWGYRNMCQFVGCDWHLFRGGQDIIFNKDLEDVNKVIPYDEWMAFFRPLFQKAYGAFNEQQALLRGEAS